MPLRCTCDSSSRRRDGNPTGSTVGGESGRWSESWCTRDCWLTNSSSSPRGRPRARRTRIADAPLCCETSLTQTQSRPTCPRYSHELRWWACALF
jgi:hypothetical protein